MPSSEENASQPSQAPFLSFSHEDSAVRRENGATEEGSRANGNRAEDEGMSTNIDIVIRLSMPPDGQGNQNHATTEELVPFLVSQIQQLLNNAGNAQTVAENPGNAQDSTANAGNAQTSTSNAGNASLSQSTDAHSGNYSVKVAGTSSSNKRLSYKELSLKAGEYTMEFYVKAATADGASVRPGYAIINSDGSITGGDSYKYGDYVNDISNTTWVKVTHTFTLSSDGTYCVLIMNAKNPGKDVLIDDFKLTSGTATIIE